MTELESNSHNLTLVCVLNHYTLLPHGDLRGSTPSYEHKTWLFRSKNTSETYGAERRLKDDCKAASLGKWKKDGVSDKNQTAGKDRLKREEAKEMSDLR